MRNQKWKNCVEGKMNYHTLEDYFLKVEKRFLILAAWPLYSLRDNVIEMASQNLYLKPKISIPNCKY
jgi:hypothetical protein